ncbi:MAG: T9SS-dependent M36 family metallopeptidase [Lewinellaceae bacterium]|nr:T9SS-dependent M36 family metallopeptidase [Lewinellaceae bacterium]
MTKFFFLARAMATIALFAVFSSASAQQFQTEITTYLQAAKSKWALTDEDVSNRTVSDQYTDRETGITYTYLQQQVSGINIFNAVSAMAIRNGEVVYFTSRFIPNAAQQANAATPAIKAEDAINAAAAHLDIALAETPVLLTDDNSRKRFTFTDCGIAKNPIRVDLVYVSTGDAIRLAWNVNIAMRTSADWWNVRIDAQTGAFLEKNNWTVRCDFGPGHTCDRHGNFVAKKSGDASAAHTGSASAGAYNVFALPLEAPNFGPRSLVTNPELALASPFGWHDTDGAAGAEYTFTRGNNVYAYEDQDDDDQPGYSPDGGAGLQFDFPLDLGQNPEFNQDAAITNLFYVNNMIHDILYRHGFTEAAGNFQENNYGNDGEGNDYVRAEALDGGGTNNANFSTPDDGFSGRMQMFLWLSGAPSILTVHVPADIAADYDAVEASFGPGLSAPITSDLVLYEDANAPATDACDPALNAFDIEGKIVVVDRGNCPFVDKAQLAEDAGALAVIVINNTGGAPFSMGGNGLFSIPAVMISQADGNLIKAKLNNGQTVNATLGSAGAAGADRDGSLDNGIVIHEYGHGVSNRMTGGPSNSNCLFNGEQGGEGWSDWLGLILTIEPGDAGADARGIGTFAINDTSGNGIRRFPYSTDMSINGQTYGDLSLSSEVHNIGEIWSQALWDMTWKLIDQEGFDPDWYNGDGGNNTALRLVLEGMRLQPCGPGFLDARDAILAADEMLYASAHRCLIWEAFAGRGMGLNASQGSANQAGDETEDFTLPTYCQTAVQAPTASFIVDVEVNCFGVFKFTDQSTNIPQGWLWDFGDGETSTAISPTHSYAEPGTYLVTLTVTNTLGEDTHTLTVNYQVPPAPDVVPDVFFCDADSVTLNAGVAAGNTANWFVDGNLVFTGTSYTATGVTSPTVYTVQQLEEKPVGQAGPVDNTFGGGGNHNSGFDGRLLFEAFVPFRLISVNVYAQGAGNRTIRLYDASNNVIQTVTTPLQNGFNTIALNMDIPLAGNYSLGNVSENLYRNNAGVAYPYVLDNVVRIYSSNATTNPLGFYYYFYNWQVQEKPCIGESATITVHPDAEPVAGFTAATNGLVSSFTNTSNGSITSMSWDFGDGSPVSNEQNPQHVYASPGTYTVGLTVANSCGSSTYEIMVTVGLTAAHDPKDAFAVRVFPNPATDRLNIDFLQAATGPVRLALCDATSRTVLDTQYPHAAAGISVDVSNLAPGMYMLRLSTKDGAITRKVGVVR